MEKAYIKTIKEIYRATRSVLEEYFLPEPANPVPWETQRILSHPEDRKLYLDALERLQRGESERETIELSTGIITIT